MGGATPAQQVSMFESMLAAVDEWVCAWDPEGRFVYANAALQRSWGLPRTLWCGKTNADVGDAPELVAQFARERQQVIETGQRIAGEVRFRKANGSTDDRWLEYVLSPVLSPDGSVPYVTGVLRETTGRRRSEEWARAEEALSKSEEAVRESASRLAAAFEALPSAVGFVDTDGKFVLSNREMHRYLPSGVVPSRDHAAPTRWRAWHPDGRPVERHDFPTARALRGQKVLPGLEMLHTQENGKEIWTLVATVPVLNDEGRITGVASVITDINALKQAEEALRASEGRLRALVENLPGGAVFILDRDMRYLVAEGEALASAGFKPKDFVGRTLDEVLPPDLAAGYADKFERALAGESFEHEHQAHGRTFISRGVPLGDAAGEVYAVLAVSYDITERKRSEETLRQNEAELRRTQEELEDRVRTRTADLAHAVDALQQEVAERRSDEKQIKALVGQVLTVQEEERRRIARDIHDQIGQQMTALRVNLASIHTNAWGRTELLVQISHTQQLAEELDGSISFLTWDLRPATLDHLGLADALGHLVRSWSERFHLPVEYDTAGLDGTRLDATIEINLYRVTQEALHNIYKHAEATSVTVLLQRQGNDLVLVIEDDGRGFGSHTTQPRDRGGMGLVGMRERVNLIGGSIDIESQADEGTTVLIRVPIGLPAEPHING